MNSLFAFQMSLTGRTKIILLSLILLLIFADESYSQPFRYLEKVFEKTDTLKNIEYTQAAWLNNPIAMLAEYNIHEGEEKTEMRPLYMDIFMPTGDTVKKRPAIIFAHSGGFLIGNRQNDDMLALCDSFAQRGYVTATIDYRRGMGAKVIRFWGIMIGLEANETNGYRAFYRAHQDARSAIRFLKYNAETFGIDTSQIFFTGSSAGAILAIQNLYLDKPAETDSAVFLPPFLGGLDANGVQGIGGKANGVTAFWGSLQKPELIEDEKSPIFLVHGTDDDVVPFKKGVLLGNIEVPISTVSLQMPEAYGSFCIDTALQNRNIPHETYFVEGKKHEFYGVDTGEFPVDGPNAYWDTIIWKTSNFLFDIFRPEADFQTELQNLTAVFSNTSTDIYQANWNFGDETFGVGNQIEHVFALPGNFKVTLTACNKNMACDTISKMVKIDTQVSAPVNLMTEISISPNPASGCISISGLAENSQIRIIGITGEIAGIWNYCGNGPFDIGNLDAGIYVVEIKNRHQYKKNKLVIN